jgi:tetratricopeptide (TPR) repeat protein
VSDETSNVDKQLEMARRVLTELETKAAGYTVLTIPAELVIEIQDKRAEIERLEAVLSGNVPDLPNMLPRAEPFYGRETELQRGLQALAPETRGWGLIVDGIGGIGKTALAVRLAYLCREQNLFEVFLFVTAKQTYLLPDGERNVAGTHRDLDGMLGDLARAIGATGVAQASGDALSRELLAALKRYNGPRRRVLLILDNLETLNPAEQERAVVFLSGLPPYCKGITTSRRQVVDNAAHLRLEQLDWEATRQIIVGEMGRNDWLDKELNRVGAARWPELHDAAGGSPLALHWLLGLMGQKRLSLDGIVRLMREKHSDNSPLHHFIYREARQSMTGNDWLVLSSLALFAAPADFTVLLALTELSRMAQETALERLLALSLVNAATGDGPYSLHPLTRRLAADELARDPAQAAERQLRFGRYWTAYAERYGGSGKEAYKTFDRLAVAWPNLEAAARLLYDLTGLPETITPTAAVPDTPPDDLTSDAAQEAARRLIALERALSQFLHFHGYWAEGLQLAGWCYAAARARGEWQNAGGGAYNAAWIHCLRRETATAQGWAAAMNALLARGGGKENQALAIRLQGLLAEQAEEWTTAEQHFQTALTACRELNDKNSEASVLNDLGNLAYQRQNYPEAAAYYRQGLTLAETLGNKEVQANYLGNLGELMLAWERPEDARLFVEQALVLAQEVGRQEVIGGEYWHLARLCNYDGALAEALALAEKGLAIYERLQCEGLPELQAFTAELRARLAESGAPPTPDSA